MFNVVATVAVSKSKVQNLLVSAFEGGCDWITKLKSVRPETHNPADFEEGGIHYDADFHDNLVYLYPFIEGYGLEIKADFDERTFLLNTTSIQKGLELMAQNEPRHFKDVIEDNDDATTAEVFLQLAMMGEVVVG